MSCPDENGQPTADELQIKALQESKRKRRQAFVDLVQKAGYTPARVDITQLMSDEQASEAIRRQADHREAQKMAAELGRPGLMARLHKAGAALHEQVRRSTQEISTDDVRAVMAEMLASQQAQATSGAAEAPSAAPATPPAAPHLNGTNGAHKQNDTH